MEMRNETIELIRDVLEGCKFNHQEAWKTPAKDKRESARWRFQMQRIEDAISATKSLRDMTTEDFDEAHGITPPAQEPKNEWREAVLALCEISHLSFREGDPKKTLNDILSFEVSVALDPRVNGGKVLMDAATLRSRVADLLHLIEFYPNISSEDKLQATGAIKDIKCMLAAAPAPKVQGYTSWFATSQIAAQEQEKKE